MKTLSYIKSAIIAVVCLGYMPAMAQNDTTMLQGSTVTVEREFRPTIQSAGKIDVQPEPLNISTTPAEVKYSDYSGNVTNPDFNFNDLGFAETNFSHAKPLHGFLRGGIGHVNSQLDFNYRVTDRQDIILDVNAAHLAQWGLKTMSQTKIGLDFSKFFDNAHLYFGANGKNIFFTRYGRYWNYTDVSRGTGIFQLNGYKGYNAYSCLPQEDLSSQWEINTRVGVRSLSDRDIQYKVQTGYEAFIMKRGFVEHIINTQAMLDYRREEHHAGVDLAVENHMYQADMKGFEWSPFKIATGDTVAKSYHAIKAEPYYQYEGQRFSIHAGINLDLCFGKQKDKVFLPSPNVNFEAKLTEDWLALYGGAIGDWQTSSVKEHFQLARFLHPENEIATRQTRTYIPVDAFLGLKMRPHNDILIDIYAHYQLNKYDVFLVPDSMGYFNLTGSDHDCWKIGGKFYYHYRDVVSILLDGYYNIRNMKNDAFYTMGLPKGKGIDREPWKITLRVEAKINSKISLYSSNYIIGSRYVVAPLPTGDFSSELSGNRVVALQPVIDLNIGAQYSFNRWLSVYLQLNNYLHRKHEIFYGYQTQGINFMAGVNWTF